MIKYISTSNFDKIENRVLSHPEQPYITDRFKYYLEPVGSAQGYGGRLSATAEGIRRAKRKRLHFILRRTWNNENVTFIRTGRDRPQEN